MTTDNPTTPPIVPHEPIGEFVWVPRGLLGHAIGVMEGTLKFCQPDDSSEEAMHYGGQCLSELTSVVDQLKPIAAAPSPPPARALDGRFVALIDAYGEAVVGAGTLYDGDTDVASTRAALLAALIAAPHKEPRNERSSNAHTASSAPAAEQHLFPPGPVEIVGVRVPNLATRDNGDGSISVLLDEFEYARVNYDHRYTDNRMRRALANAIVSHIEGAPAAGKIDEAMVERVAKAICTVDCDGDLSRAPRAAIEHYEAMARAALEAAGLAGGGERG